MPGWQNEYSKGHHCSLYSADVTKQKIKAKKDYQKQQYNKQS